MTDPKTFNRFAVFYFANFYPAGGMNDAVGSYDSLEEARHYVEQDVCNPDNEMWGYYQILDMDERRVVLEREKQ